MAKNIDDKLVLAISSRALFDLSESHKVYLSSGVEAYRRCLPAGGKTPEP
jgi:5'-nucleotidase